MIDDNDILGEILWSLMAKDSYYGSFNLHRIDIVFEIIWFTVLFVWVSDDMIMEYYLPLYDMWCMEMLVTCFRPLSVEVTMSDIYYWDCQYG